VFASVGYGPGIALYLIFGCAAAFSGWILWQVFLALDSSRFPLLSYGDTFFRVYGKKSRHFINVTQSLQQFMTVSVLILSCGTTISQLANESICFIACMIIFMVIGMCLGLIRSLQRLGWLANASVWLNVVCFLIM
jgi:amino acid permease